MNYFKRASKPLQRQPTLLDRVAIGLFSGLCTLVLASFVWFALSWKILLHWRADSIPFEPVIYLSVAVALLGFLLAENVVITVVGWLVELFFGVGRL